MAVELCPTTEWYFAPRTTSLAAATRHDYTAITIQAPENTSRTFKSVIVQIDARSANAATASRGSVTSWLIGIKLGSVAFDDVTVTDTISDSNEDGRRVWTRDVTSYFAANFGSGTSETCQVGFQFAQTGTNAESFINVCCKLIVTYEADLAGQDTRVMTLRIPLDSPTAALTNSLAEIGTNQVPDLDDLLTNLASKTYRQITFDLFTNEAGNDNTTDWTFGLALDSEAEANDGNHEQTPGYANSYTYHWRRDDMDTTVVHAFKARGTKTGVAEKLCVVLVVTLTYSRTSSSKDFVSLKIPYYLATGLGGTATSGDMGRAVVKVPVIEANAALKQSGVFLGVGATNTLGTLSVAVGGQTARGYTTMMTASGNGNLGIGGVMQRFDSGGAAGSGLTLAAGDNDIVVSAYCGTNNNNGPNATTGYVLLNYECDKTDGVARTCAWMIGATAADAIVRQMTVAPTIPESNYRLIAVGVEVNMRQTAAINAMPAEMQIEYESGEGPGAGWETVGILSGVNNILSWLDATRFFNRWPGDLRDLMDFETSRKWMHIVKTIPGGPGSSWIHATMWFSYSSATYTVAGTASGFSDTLTISLHRASTGEKIAETTREGDGAYSFTVYDDVNQYYVEIVDEHGVCGRSQNDVAS